MTPPKSPDRSTVAPSSPRRVLAHLFSRRTRRPVSRLRRLWLRFLWCVFGAMVLGAAAVWWMGCRMPGRSYRGTLPEMSGEERRLAGALEGHVQMLAGTIGERNLGHMAALRRAEDWVEASLREAGYEPERLEFEAWGQKFCNIEAVKRGGAEGVGAPASVDAGTVVIGAHYDSAEGTPGADDNASAVAVMIELARAFATTTTARTVRFVAFANEEPPFFWTPDMGSVHYARLLAERHERVTAMLALETLGYYRAEPGTQHYPVPLLKLAYPSAGDFVGFVGNFSSRAQVRRSVGAFRGAAAFPSQGAALPSWVQGVGWSDHWSFWQEGWPGLMVTDTAPFRNPHYHGATDTPDRLDYDRMARVTQGLKAVVRALADE